MNAGDLDVALQKFVEDVEKIKGEDDADFFRIVAVSYHRAILRCLQLFY